VDLEDLQPALLIWQADLNLHLQAAGAQHGLIQHVFPARQQQGRHTSAASQQQAAASPQDDSKAAASQQHGLVKHVLPARHRRRSEMAFQAAMSN
jgi:hypothetical protein